MLLVTWVSFSEQFVVPALPSLRHYCIYVLVLTWFNGSAPLQPKAIQLCRHHLKLILEKTIIYCQIPPIFQLKLKLADILLSTFSEFMPCFNFFFFGYYCKYFSIHRTKTINYHFQTEKKKRQIFTLSFIGNIFEK